MQQCAEYVPFPEFSLGVVWDTCRARGRLLGDVRHTLSPPDIASRHYITYFGVCMRDDLERMGQLLLMCPYAEHARTRNYHTVQSTDKDLVNLARQIRAGRITLCPSPIQVNRYFNS